jgi:hypothetical protein
MKLSVVDASENSTGGQSTSNNNNAIMPTHPRQTGTKTKRYILSTLENTENTMQIKQPLILKTIVLLTIACALLDAMVIKSFTFNDSTTQKTINKDVSPSLSVSISSYSSSLSPFDSCGVFNFTEPAKCGGNKCFLKISNEPTIGYLVPHDGSKVKDNILYTMMKGYDLARYLESKYQIKHLLLEPPKKLIAPPPFCVQEQLSNASNFELIQTRTHVKYDDYENFIYQKNQVMPTPSIMLKPWKTKYEGKEVWHKFVKDHVVNGTQFMQQFELDAQISIKVLIQFPRLVHDYQVLTDRYGNMYHLDLDRAFEDIKISSEEKTTKILNSIEYMVHEFEKAIKENSN